LETTEEESIHVRSMRRPEAYAGKKIDIVGGVYDLATGKVALV